MKKKLNILIIIFMILINVNISFSKIDNIYNKEIKNKEIKNKEIKNKKIKNKKITKDNIRKTKNQTKKTNNINYEANKLYSATVIKVVDGDTIHVIIGNQREKIRFIGVDTPESVHSKKEKNSKEGIIASSYTKQMLNEKEIKIEFDVQKRDKYGRLLGYIWIDGELFNEILLKEGYARIVTYPPNLKYINKFLNAQESARESKNGFWK